MPPAPPHITSRRPLGFDLHEELGRGSMGPVYRATRLGDPRQYVVKVLLDLSEEARRDLINEARVLWGVGHPLVRLPVRLGCVEDRHFLVLEYVAGRPLYDVPADRALAQRVLEQVGTVLRSVHRAGAIHGDLKPGNLIVDTRGDVHLIDFGLARRTTTFLAGSLGPTDALGGTPGYMAPELWDGAPLSPEADWYSLGAVLHELLVGAPPLAGSRLDAHAGHLEATAAALLDPNPDRREIRADLGRWLGPQVGLGTVPFHGRRDELEALREWVRLPGAATCVVTGPPGSGKSRLIREALVDTPALAARCYPFEARSYTGLDWLEPALDLDMDAAEWVRAEVTRRGSREDAALVIRDALSARGQPLTVYIEDAHLLDHDAVAVLRVLVARLRVPGMRLILEVGGDAPQLSPLASVEEAGVAGFSVFRLDLGAARSELEGDNPLAAQLIRPDTALRDEALQLLPAEEIALLEILAMHEPGLVREDADLVARLLGFTRAPSVQRLRLLGYVASARQRITLFHRGFASAIAARIDAPRREKIHHALLEVLGPDGRRGPEGIPHLAAIGDTAQARDLAREVAVRAETDGAFERAAGWYRRMLDWQPPPDEARVVQRCLARCLEGSGALREAADVHRRADSDDERFAAARCLFDAGDYDAALEVVGPELARHGIAPRPRMPVLVLGLLTGLGALMIRPPRLAADGSDAHRRRAELCWLVARGATISHPPISLLMSVRALRSGLRSGSAQAAGGALAFLGGGVFLQLPLLRRWSGSWLATVRTWSETEPMLELSAELWEGVAAVSQGRWKDSRRALDRVSDDLPRHAEMTFERVAAAICQLATYQHEGDYQRLLDGALREVDLARRRGDARADVIFSLLCAQGFLAAGQTAPVDRALERAWAWLPERFVPQRFDTVEAAIHRDLALGDVEAAHRQYLDLQRPLWRAGGKLAAVTRFRNAKMGGRVGLLAGSESTVRGAIRDLEPMGRADAAAYARWLRHALDGTVCDHAHALSEAMRAGDAHAQALGILVQTDDPEGRAAAALRGRGVSDPARWAAWMVPVARR